MMLTINPIFVRVVAVMAIAMFSFAAIMSWLDGEGDVTPLFLLFAALGVVVLLTTGTLYVDDEQIVYRTPLGRYRIAWDDVIDMERDEQGTSLAFHGKNKRLVVIGPSYWPRKKRAAMSDLILSQRRQRSIPMYTSFKAAFMLSKNTRAR